MVTGYNRKAGNPFHSLKWQIVSIALVSVIGLAFFVVQVIKDAHHKATLLNEIKEESYPTQAHLLAALHNLKFIHRELENSVTTGDADAVRETDKLANMFRKHLVEVDRLSSDRNALVIIDDFNTYHQLSKKLALELVNPYAEVTSLQPRGKTIAEKYEVLTQTINGLYQNYNLQFANGINDATSRAGDSKWVAIFGGFLVVGLVMLVALLTANGIIRRIRAMVEKLKTIALEDGDLNVRLSLSGNDEMTELAYWFNGIIKKLEDTSRKSENNILRIANTDELSGLFNRRYLINWFQHRIELDPGDDKFTVLFLDLDDFKPVNDSFGHEAGDELIAESSKRISNLIASYAYNSTGRNDENNAPVVGRLGGDEFMVVIPSIIEYRSIESLAIHIRSVITKPYNLNDAQCVIGVSIGISRYPEDATDRDSLLECADLAMYEAKRRGKNEIAFFDYRLEQENSTRNTMERLLKGQNLHEELSLVYQPKFQLDNGNYLGAEALLRWDSEELGSVSPQVFIPFAEEKQLIVEIDLWVLDEVCRQISEWITSGFWVGKIAINISARTLRLSSLPVMVADVLQKHKISAANLQLEITESAILDLNNSLTSNIQHLRDLGLSIAMDDFGAGHSSLLLLINNQIDLLKLDKSMIDDINNNIRRQKIVRSIIMLAENLGITTLAEGIENKDQWECLQSLNCTQGQGYYYARPLIVQHLVEQFLGSTANGYHEELKRAS